jgi:hypothetical protein
MKNKIVTRILLPFLLFILVLPGARAQLDNMGKILTGGVGDAEKIAGAYLAPFTNAFGANLNSGWFTTAKPHSVLGFDLTLSVNFAMIPEEAKSMNLVELDLDAVTLGETSPTIASPLSDVPASLQYQDVGPASVTYDLPKGTGLPFVPAPTLQLGVGLPMDTDIMVRFVPQVQIGELGNLGLWGIGVKHSLKQYLPFVKRVPFWNVSAMAGYTRFYSNALLDFQPEDINAVDQTVAVNFTDQSLELGVSSFTANILVSADIPFISAFAGVGLNTTSSSLKMLGYFPVPAFDEGIAVVTDQSALQDPVNVKFKNDGSSIQPRVTAGLKLKLAVIHLHAGYTYSNYSVVSGGIGISFR